ncbi:MAG: valine--tRNA ligase [Planctomycetota bacterium]
MADEIAKQYDPTAIEAAIYARWLAAHSFRATPDDRDQRYVIMMPLPNVTGALHMGHAMDNVMQDLLVRWHRMRGDNTLWMAGTDHAGIATQAVVEKRLLELEGKTRKDLGREALVKRIWDWKEQYQQRIVKQQQAMGCSCDWERQRFTMDAVCARAVRWTFFKLFADGLIYRGDRMVNWDCHLETAVADDEINHEAVDGHFWHLRYPVIDPKPGEPDHVVVATTRPETMLGDTAVAVHPDPQGALEQAIAEVRMRLSSASTKDQPQIAAELAQLEERRATLLDRLIRLRDMARAGRQLRLPLVDRVIPLICDEWAKPALGSGCVKITPAHDPNDYEVWKRHRPRVAIINLLNSNGSLNANAGPYAGLDRFVARDRVVADLTARGLVAAVEARRFELGHSDRSKTVIEPFVSKQWFVRMDDVPGGIVCGRGTRHEFRAPGLAQAAIDAASPTWSSPTGRQLRFHPDERYRQTYSSWLREKRDWCISRQLWWGHRIPIWTTRATPTELDGWRQRLATLLGREDVIARVSCADGTSALLADKAAVARLAIDGDGRLDLLVCLRDAESDSAHAARLEAGGLTQDPDVLDTWFSSAVWPHSTLGWPDPKTARIEAGQLPLGADADHASCLDYYYPGTCLVTARDIITLWVARMVLAGLYNLGDLPFTEVFIHANILDGKGVRMSKSKGNGIDPVDIIERYGTDAMRYVLCELQTGSQDIRLPVHAISPFTGKTIDLATAKHGRSIFTYLCPESGQEFDVLGTMAGVPAAKLMSDRFEVGRNFCNKLWNAARFALMNLAPSDATAGAGAPKFVPLKRATLPAEDRWILSRVARAIADVSSQLEAYNPSAAVGAARDFFWSELCDWYLELVKPRMRDEAEAPRARQVLAVALDQVLRLLHPFLPFITEELWGKLAELAPERGIEQPLAGCRELMVTAAWPAAETSWRDDALDAEVKLVQEIVRAIREVRAKYTLPQSTRIPALVRASGVNAAVIGRLGRLIQECAWLASITVDAAATRTRDSATAVVGDIEIYLPGLVDLDKERERLEKQLAQCEQNLASTRAKLSNESFVARAKPEVVDRERQRVGELEAQIASIRANLEALR